MKQKVSSEDFHKFSRWPAKTKLEWLEEAGRFVKEILGKKKFRKYLAERGKRHSL